MNVISVPDELLNADDKALAQSAQVAEPLASELRAVHVALQSSGQLLTQEEAERHYRTFREQFGPDVLASLDGEALLNAVHGRRQKTSLVYWLEFKDNDEFPGARFGSIGGGSALKFGIYQAAETWQWMAAGKGNYPSPISLDEAIVRVRRHRDQLVQGARVLASLPSDPSKVDYSTLQQQMEAAAPELAETSWGHKYLRLSTSYQRETPYGASCQAMELI